MGKTDWGIRPATLDGGVCELVRTSHVSGHAEYVGDVSTTTRWKLAAHPSVGGVDGRLVDRAPHSDEVAELVHDPIDEGDECSRGFRVGPPALAHEPERAGEV